MININIYFNYSSAPRSSYRLRNAKKEHLQGFKTTRTLPARTAKRRAPEPMPTKRREP